WSWRERSVEQSGRITRSFGWATKNDVSLGMSLSHKRYEVEGAAAGDPRTVAAFRAAAVPIGEDRIGPFLEWRGYRNDFLRTFDLQGLALQEDHRLGHDAVVRAYPVLRALGSTRDVLGLSAGAAYTVPLGDGLARVAAEAVIETQGDRVADGLV